MAREVGAEPVNCVGNIVKRLVAFRLGAEQAAERPRARENFAAP